MAESVAGDALGQAGLERGLPDGFLQRILVYVVAAFGAGTGVHRQAIRGKHILPEPFLGGVGVFAFQGIGEVDAAVTLGQVAFVQQLDAFQVFL